MGGSQGCGVCNKDDGDSDDNDGHCVDDFDDDHSYRDDNDDHFVDDLDDDTLTGWERKLMVDANQKWGRAQAIEWMKEVNFLRINLSWLIVNGGWLVVDFGLWMFYETSFLREDHFG